MKRSLRRRHRRRLCHVPTWCVTLLLGGLLQSLAYAQTIPPDRNAGLFGVVRDSTGAAAARSVLAMTDQSQRRVAPAR